MRITRAWLFSLVVAHGAVGCSGSVDGEVVDDGGATDDSATTDDAGPTDGGADSGTGTDTGGAKDTGTKPADTGTPPTDTGTPPTDSGTWPSASATLEQQILEETNKRRAAGADCRTGGKFGPAPPLTMHPQLQQSARLHSLDMATKNYFSHTAVDGRSPFDRMKAAGYKGGTMGENIAAGNATAAATMTQWMNSDGHCANIMNPAYKHLGVGYAYGASSTYKHYWTQNFGAGG